jgi:hypothetical protein
MSEFTKKDTGKPMVSLVEPKFILGMAEILTFGAKKYGVDNWKDARGDDIRRITDALLRHTLAYVDGEMLDSETGLSHTYSIACNAMFLNYLMEEK